MNNDQSHHDEWLKVQCLWLALQIKGCSAREFYLDIKSDWTRDAKPANPMEVGYD